MTGIFSVDGVGLRWVRILDGPGHESVELRDEEVLLGTLRYDLRRASRVEAEADGQRWIFQSEPFTRGQIKILDPVNHHPPAVFEGRPVSSAVRGVLTFADGRKLYWVNEGNRGETWLFQTENGEPLVRFVYHADGELIADLFAEAGHEPYLSLLLLLWVPPQTP